MSEIRLLNEVARWHTRKVRYLAGAWDQLEGVIPNFELSEFHDGPEEPANPFLRSVIRLPLRKAERRIPVGIVSNNYKLVQHTEVGDRCDFGMAKAGVDISKVRCELGLTELDQWMNLRLYFPHDYSSDGYKLDLRVEVFNSVDGSSRLTLLLGWFRFICSNGLVVGKTLTEIRDIHNQALDLMKIEDTIAAGTELLNRIRNEWKKLEDTLIEIDQLRPWVDKTLSKIWGKKAPPAEFFTSASPDLMWNSPILLLRASLQRTRRGRWAGFLARRRQ